MRLALVICAAWLVGCAHSRSTQESVRSPQATKLAPEIEQAMARSVFLGRLRRTAESGTLFDPASAGRLLEMKLEAMTAPAFDSPKDCGDGSVSSGTVTTANPAGTWFKALSSGAGHLSVPAFTINPSTTTGDPAVAYKMYHSVHCRDWQRLQDETEAEVEFQNIPGYACVTVADIRAAIPGARFVAATDGVYLVSYRGRLDDDSGTTLTFQFRAGVECALGASIRQDQEDGRRYGRARYKFEACRRPVEREFCVAHGNFGWSDREALKAMVTLVYRKCGTITSFYVKEPLTGQAAPKLPPRNGSGPCDDLGR